MTGCCANTTPAVAVEEGWVWITNVLAAPAISRKLPRSELVDKPTIVAVPLPNRVPLASGVPAVGRTRTFCHVNVEGVPPLLRIVTVKVSWFEVTEVIAAAVPLFTPLMFLLGPP